MFKLLKKILGKKANMYTNNFALSYFLYIYTIYKVNKPIKHASIYSNSDF